MHIYRNQLKTKMDKSIANGNCEKECTKQEENNFDDIGEYYFESDHLALKGNPDYHNMLKTVAILEAQRMQVIQDLDKLLESQKQALDSPIAFVKKLQKKENLNFPHPLRIAELPEINWNQYSLTGGQFTSEKRQMTRQSLKNIPDSKNSYEDTKAGFGENSEVLVRGRPFDKSKPSSFNQLWTAEEQKRLEELLIQYPPEEVESRRWMKIAAALGNRTPTQVASRVQKYFIKLAKAGLPIPGRMPSRHNVNRKVSSRRNVLSRYYLQQPSTFFASHIPPVYMNEADDEYSNNTHSLSSSVDGDVSNDKFDFASDDDGISQEMKDTPEYQELLYLKKLREKKLHDHGLAQHVGYSCNRCNVAPIIGTRWHCVECPTKESVDFCSDCVDCMHECNFHTSDHKLEPITQAQSQNRCLDRDYMHFLGGGDYNYLDPNYMPAS
ncbi:ZZ-type zinc finger-containing protein 3 isoform X2 [Centruroides vittatus]|uniref:ZZ-type zinc finger-containing protein 3 isoform X2 n=1 Tax=Centruroides vittatus TaxID=120091 RepID=UPI00350F13C9